ncbi:MAG: hypothetical protein K5675_11325 [Lachnospiraceae bacterium]|nr:hypothetical protein [Lachnospiraceae bacterium]
MITRKEQLKEALMSCGINEGWSVREEMPNGKYTFIGIDEVRSYNLYNGDTVNWLPAVFKNIETGNCYEISVNAVCYAKGLVWKTRNLYKRAEILNNAIGEVFVLVDTKTKKITLKMDAKKGGKKAGDVIEVKERVFMEKHMDDYVSNKNLE